MSVLQNLSSYLSLNVLSLQVACLEIVPCQECKEAATSEVDGAAVEKDDIIETVMPLTHFLL